LRQLLSWKSLLGALAVYLLLQVTVLRPSLEDQVEACFADVVAAIDSRDPGDLLDQVSIDYPYGTLWPEFSQLLAVRGASGPDVDPRYEQRQRVGSLLGQMFFMLKEDSPQFALSVLAVQEPEKADQPVRAQVRVQYLGGRAPRELRSKRGSVEVEFLLERQGVLWPRVVIVGHERW
jgi:hypothetical protein